MPEVVAVVEAMAERALREIGSQPYQAAAMMKAERLMFQAANSVRVQHLVRADRLLKWLRDCDEDDTDTTEGAPTDE